MGVHIGDGFVISKYEEDGGILLKKLLGVGEWAEYKIYKEGSHEVADHANKRFNRGDPLPNRMNGRRDIFTYDTVDCNCEHFEKTALSRLMEEGNRAKWKT